jgi:hypothetical protein
MADGIEFTSKVGKVFTAAVLKSSSYATLETVTTITEVTPGRYRLATNRTGVAWMEATAGATKAYGWANLDRPGPNGFAEVVDSLSDAAGVAITVLPLNAAVQDRVDGTTINLFYREVISVAIAITNASGQVSLTGKTLAIVIEGRTKSDRAVIANADIAKNGNTATFTPPIGITSKVGQRKWSLRDVTGGSDGVVLAHGLMNVNYAPADDA